MAVVSFSLSPHFEAELDVMHCEQRVPTEYLVRALDIAFGAEERIRAIGIDGVLEEIRGGIRHYRDIISDIRAFAEEDFSLPQWSRVQTVLQRTQRIVAALERGYTVVENKLSR